MLPSIFILDLIDFRSSPDSSVMKSDYHGRDLLDACHQNPSKRQDVDVNKAALTHRQDRVKIAVMIPWHLDWYDSAQRPEHGSAKRDAKALNVFTGHTDHIQVFHLCAFESLVPPASHPDDSDIPTSSDLLLLKPHLPARMPSCAKMLKRQTGGSLRDDLL